MKNKNIENEKNSAKKIIIIKDVNRSIKNKINVINILYYIFAVIISVPVQFAIMDKLDFLQVESDFSILIVCMFVYYILSVIVYGAFIHPILSYMEKEISDNVNMINKLRTNNKEESKNILSTIKFNNICKQTKNL